MCMYNMVFLKPLSLPCSASLSGLKWINTLEVISFIRLSLLLPSVTARLSDSFKVIYALQNSALLLFWTVKQTSKSNLGVTGQ